MKKTRYVRLPDTVASALGLKIRKKPKKGNPTYHISEEIYQQTLELRQLASPKLKTVGNVDCGLIENVNPGDGVNVVSMKALNEDGEFLTVEKFCEIYKLPYSEIVDSKLITHQGGVPYWNLRFKSSKPTSKVGFSASDFSKVLERFKDKYTSGEPETTPHCLPESIITDNTARFHRLVITDTHIGMDPDPDSTTIYNRSWGVPEIHRTLQSIVNVLVSNGRKDVLLVIDDLGDYVDGYDGYTTRKGHKMPQKLNNRECFETAVQFKLELLKAASSRYKEVIINHVCNDNHAGDFAYCVNSTVSAIATLSFKNVSSTLRTRFISHYRVGCHTFILTHGKDKQHMKFGWKPSLDDKVAQKLEEYVRQHNLIHASEDTFVELSKGDSHIGIADYSHPRIDYVSYPCLSPPSEYIKLNYSNSRRGFTFQKIHPTQNLKETTVHWL